MNADVMKWIGMMAAAGAWFALVIMKLADPDTFVQFVQYSLIGVGAHVMTKMPAAMPSAPAKEGGYAGIGILLLIIAVGLYLTVLAGCVGLTP